MADVLTHTTLAILAGGEGSRMGKPKGLLTIAGRPILEHILRTAQWPGPTMLVTAPGRQNPPGYEKFDSEVTDPVACLGPMRGVLTALDNAVTNQIVIMPVDMPSIGHEPLRWLAEQLHETPEASALMLTRWCDGKHIVEPLPAAFCRSARTIIEQCIKEKRNSLRRLVESKGIRTIEAPQAWPTSVWNNLNLPQDAAQFESDEAHRAS